jgi:hypothetical protein
MKGTYYNIQSSGHVQGRVGQKFGCIGKSFSYKKDKNGILTDSIQFVGIYPECTNISVGYNTNTVLLKHKTSSI